MMSNWLEWLRVPERAQKIEKIPVHVAIIMDGNGRWAQRRGLPRTAGHRAGMERIRDAVKTCLDFGVNHLTLYAFSTENWFRPEEEVGFLMNLFREALKKEVAELHRQGVRLRFLGLRTGLAPDLLATMVESEKLTAGNDKLFLNLALNYGGRSELVEATKAIVAAVQQGKLQPEEINEQELSSRMFTAGQPDPDLLIRPSGEYRISNFLIWQSAYAEFYFTKTNWPDFGRTEMLEAFRYFSERERRFGRVKGGNATT